MIIEHKMKLNALKMVGGWYGECWYYSKKKWKSDADSFFDWNCMRSSHSLFPLKLVVEKYAEMRNSQCSNTSNNLPTGFFFDQKYFLQMKQKINSREKNKENTKMRKKHQKVKKIRIKPDPKVWNNTGKNSDKIKKNQETIKLTWKDGKNNWDESCFSDRK